MRKPKNILPIYDNNYIGDGVERIEYVLRRAEEIIQENRLDVNDNILYILNYKVTKNICI